METNLNPIKEILVPLDFSEASVEALHFAMRIAAPTQSHLHLLYVEDDPTLIHKSVDQRFRDKKADAMSKKLLEVMSDHDRERFRTTTSIRFGTAFHEIECYAKENQIELIVMGNTAHSALSDAILGSVSGHTIRHAVCPVLTITKH